MIPRRTVMKGLAGVPLAAVLADPRLARAAADELQQVSLTTADGRTVEAALALPDRIEDPVPGVILIHEWWGLNDQIKSVARELAQQGFATLAVDLFGGEVATTPERARELTGAVKPEQAIATLTAWVDWLEKRQETSSQVGVVGWCFGGGWALRTAIHAPVDAAVIYYGNVDVPVDDLQKIDAPVLGHFATKDQHITESMVNTFQERMREAGQPLELYWYDADHAFANPTGARYDAGAAAVAWTRTLAFLVEHLRTARGQGRADPTEQPVQTETKAETEAADQVPDAGSVTAPQ